MERGDAFVIWLDPPDSESREQLRGVAEYVRTGTRRRFASGDELLAFVSAPLASGPARLEPQRRS